MVDGFDYGALGVDPTLDPELVCGWKAVSLLLIPAQHLLFPCFPFPCVLGVASMQVAPWLGCASHDWAARCVG